MFPEGCPACHVRAACSASPWSTAPAAWGQLFPCLPLQALSLRAAPHLGSSLLLTSTEGSAGSDLLSLLQGSSLVPPAWAGSLTTAAQDDGIASYAEEQGYIKQVRGACWYQYQA